MQAGTLRSAVVTRFVATTAPSDSCPPACAGTGLPSSRAELSERAMSLCPVPPGASQNDFGASVLVSATMTRLTTGDLRLGVSRRTYETSLSFGSFLCRAGLLHVGRPPRNQPSYRHVVFFAVQIPFILLVLPSFAWRTMPMFT